MSLASANDGLDTWVGLVLSSLLMAAIWWSVLDYRERQGDRPASQEQDR